MVMSLKTFLRDQMEINQSVLITNFYYYHNWLNLKIVPKLDHLIDINNVT